jgi:ATP-dependent exoDNAse (exonuclease V) beta subunit
MGRDGPPPLVDAEARRIITASLDRTLFVEAGAGSGKTSSLVERIVNLVDRGGVPINRIAAITFTEAAARELRTRVRDALEARALDTGNRALALAAGQVEAAAFSTLHSFALRLLADHPVEAGLPPGFGVVDEITSALEFDESWRVFLGRVGDDLDLLDLQERAAALGIDLRHFAGVARRFDDNWDLLDLVDPDPPPLTEVTFDDLLDGSDDLRELGLACALPDDLYLVGLTDYLDRVDRYARNQPLDQLRVFAALRPPARNRGRSASWREPGLAAVRTEVEAFNHRLRERADLYQGEVMDHIVTLVAGFVRRRVEGRQARGELAYHDLLVLARRLLRTDDTVRRTLHQRYSRILLDEFQDTDPIQIELAVLLAADRPVGADPWTDLAAELEPGRLVVVGDPKQSIYRFRRADIAVYAETERVLVDGATRLTTNFRSVPGILEWVNHLFERAMGEGDPGRQPAYVALTPARQPGPTVTGGPSVPVSVLGGPHPRSAKIQRIREIEGHDVAASVCRVMEEGWLVERDGRWLPARLADVAVLIPSRLSLPSLEAAFVAANLPFRPETNSLVYATQEVRDVLAGVRAVVDPTNSVDVVATLRSALFAVGDDDLLDWKLAGGSWDYRRLDLDDPAIGNPLIVATDAEPPIGRTTGEVDGVGPGPDSVRSWDDLALHPVARAFSVLRAWHHDRWWSTPATLIDRIVRERRLREAALAERRPRDRWRRYRFLAEQAREFAETQGGDLHDFVDWVEVQASDLARVTEPVPPEPDDDAVRVLTIHGAKGLEFPIVVLAGAPTIEGSGRNGPQVLFPAGQRPQVKLRADRHTADFDVHASLEEMLDANERIRLHYVAATRARDHLIVSVHHKEGGRSSIGRRTWEVIEDRPDLWEAFERRGDEQYVAVTPTQLRLAGGDHRDQAAAWAEIQGQLVASVERTRPRSATGLARSSSPTPATPIHPTTAAPPPGSIDAVPASRALDGRHDAGATVSSPGAALGAAVHEVLERIDLDRPDDLPALARLCAAEHGVGDRAGDVERRVGLALASPTMQQASRVPHHRELYVAAPVGSAVVEGFVDLCLETEDGLVVVDYKTDHLAGPLDEAVAAKVDEYRLQAATYALLLGRVTGTPVAACRFLFVAPDRVVEADLPDLDRAMDEVAQLVESVAR